MTFLALVSDREKADRKFEAGIHGIELTEDHRGRQTTGGIRSFHERMTKKLRKGGR